MSLALIIAGFGGGIVRGIVGFVKHQYSYKNVGFQLYYFLAMMFLSGVVGALTASAFGKLNYTLVLTGYDSAVAFIAGYAGGDLIENIYKIVFGLKERPK